MLRAFLLATSGLLIVGSGGCTDTTSGNQPRKVYHSNTALTGSHIPYAAVDPTPTPNPNADTGGIQAGQRAFIGNSPGVRAGGN